MIFLRWIPYITLIVVAMPGVRSAAKLAERRERAVRRGFLISATRGCHVAVHHDLRDRVKVVARSLELHAEHVGLTGQPHAYAHRAALAARPLLGEERFAAARAAHHARNGAMHQWKQWAQPCDKGPRSLGGNQLWADVCDAWSDEEVPPPAPAAPACEAPGHRPAIPDLWEEMADPAGAATSGGEHAARLDALTASCATLGGGPAGSGGGSADLTLFEMQRQLGELRDRFSPLERHAAADPVVLESPATSCVAPSAGSTATQLLEVIQTQNATIALLCSRLDGMWPPFAVWGAPGAPAAAAGVEGAAVDPPLPDGGGLTPRLTILEARMAAQDRVISEVRGQLASARGLFAGLGADLARDVSAAARQAASDAIAALDCSFDEKVTAALTAVPRLPAAGGDATSAYFDELYRSLGDPGLLAALVAELRDLPLGPASPRLDGEQPTTSNQRPTTSNQRPATTNQQPTTSNQQPATNDPPPSTTTVDQRPPTSDQRPTPDDRRPSTAGRPTSVPHPPPFPTQRPTSDDPRPPAASDQQPTTTTFGSTSDSLEDGSDNGFDDGFDFDFDSLSPLRATDRLWEAMVGGYLSHRELCEIAPVSALCDELVAMARGASRTSCPASPSGSSSTSGTTWAPGPRTSSALSADIAARLARA